MLIPEKHINAIAIKPTVMNVIPNPFKGAGTLEYDNFSCIAAKLTIANNQPIPDPKAYTEAYPILGNAFSCINKDPPKIAQFTAIRGKKIPSEVYSAGLNFSIIISTNCTIEADRKCVV